MDRRLLVDAALAGADEALRHFGRSPQVWDKGNGQGPVSAADLAVDTLLKERLLAARPECGWLSEETADTPDRLTRARCFVVDPIDGTVSFLKGRSGWAISVALVEDGLPVAACVVMPATGHVYSAARGRGALSNDAPLLMPAPGAVPRIAIPRNQLGAEHWPAGSDWFTPASGGALALRLTRLAEGDVDATVTFRPVWEWDIAAGSLIAEEAGATVTDRTGAALRFNSPDAKLDGLLAAAPALHETVATRHAHRAA